MSNKKEQRLGEEKFNYQDCLMKIVVYDNANNIIVEFQDEYKARVKEGRAKNIAAGRQKKKETASKKVLSKDEFVKRIMMDITGG